MKTNRERALDILGQADEYADDTTVALTGIGFAMLEIADAVRDRTAEIITMLKTGIL